MEQFKAVPVVPAV